MSEMCDRNIEGNEIFPHLHAMSTAAEMPMVLSRNVHTKMAIRGAMIDTYPLPKGTFLKMIFLFPRWEICFPRTINYTLFFIFWLNNDNHCSAWYFYVVVDNDDGNDGM